MLSRTSVFLKTINIHGCRFASQLFYDRYGDPLEVIQLQNESIETNSLKADEVRIGFRASPINPADINQIQGVYPVKPKLPAIGGNEGFGIVEEIGSNVSSLNVGDHVIPAASGFGTWRSEAISNENNFYKIDKRIPMKYAATLQVNPCTAYRMLKDFVELKEGDTVVQNGANSAVGRCVIQIAKILGYETINVVRKRENIDELKSELESIGATKVYTEEEFLKNSRSIKSRLALNCVGGRNSLGIASTLQQNGIMVTYGGMSKQPVQGATGPFIFKDIIFRGFWMSSWYEKSAKNQELKGKRDEMYSEIADWIVLKKLVKPKVVLRQPEEYKEALKDAMETAGIKQLFVFDDNKN
uniref:Enoyl-[acyl-carrier-protein] reductase, mitochondrial n=1 Tax=Panagrolaimus superbus TaxID=310955 RepID=A0A914Z106_9BILA